MMVMMMKMMVKKIVIGNNDDDDDSDDTDGDDTGDDDDKVTLGIPETQKSPSMVWKNFMPFYNSTQPLTYHLTFCLNSFSFFFLSLKLK